MKGTGEWRLWYKEWCWASDRVVIGLLDLDTHVGQSILADRSWTERVNRA